MEQACVMPPCAHTWRLLKQVTSSCSTCTYSHFSEKVPEIREGHKLTEPSQHPLLPLHVKRQTIHSLVSLRHIAARWKTFQLCNQQRNTPGVEKQRV